MPFKRKQSAENNPSATSIGPVDVGYVRRGARKITREDLQKVVARADEIRKRFNPKGPLGRFVEDGRLLISIVKDYWKGNYRRAPTVLPSAARNARTARPASAPRPTSVCW